MWLINTKTFVLEYFVDPPSGLYAILSHTWTDNELSFHEFKDVDRASSHPGWQKIESTCRLAKEHGLKFAWVDTCCIDKSSSAELTEGINSMFRWYQEAAVCYVFLFDMPSISGNAETFEIGEGGFKSPDPKFLDAFESSRWLTRGWTLQELIAPRNVLFLDVEWKPRASKSACAKFLSTATDIDENVLEDVANLQSVLVARRMSWAAKRQTTRTEDLAYCLLGIFDINLPLLYGEGNKAFLRLQEAIVNQSCDLSLLAWIDRDPNSVYRGIFAKSPAEFEQCNQLMHSYGGQIPDTEFTITNKGLRIQSTLVRVYDQETSFLAFNLGIIDPRWRRGANGWVGIYVSKTTRGYVRSRPHELYLAGSETGHRRRMESSLIYLRKTLTAVEIQVIEKQFRNSLVLRHSSCPSMDLVDVQPRDLWCVPESLCLDPGIGLNVYFTLKMSVDKRRRPSFNVLVACSTFGEPRCAVWSEQDKLAWETLWGFLKTPKERSDFAAFDYLGNYFGKFMENKGAAVYKATGSRAVATVSTNLTPTGEGDERRYVLDVSCVWSS